MATLDLEQKHVFTMDLTLADARVLVNALGDEFEELADLVDRARGEVLTDNQEETYIVLKLVR
jgi:hypothetical protein